MRKPMFWFPSWSNTNRAAQPQKMARDLKFQKKRNCTIRVAKTKALISVFLFAYANRWFSHDAAQIRETERGYLYYKIFILILYYIIPRSLKANDY